MKSQLDEFWNYAQSIAAEELKDHGPLEYKEINPEKVKERLSGSTRP